MMFSIFIMLLSGCTSYLHDEKRTLLIASSEAFQRFSGEFENTPYFKKHKPSAIAVLPFTQTDSKTFSVEIDEEKPAEIVRRGMYNHIASLPFIDLEMYETDKRLKNAGIGDAHDVKALLLENPSKLKSILGVDAVVAGNVTHFDRFFMGIYSQVAVGCEVQLIDLDSGKLLWRAKHTSKAHGGGLSLNPIGIAVAAVSAAWNLRSEEILSQTDNLFREIVSTIDAPGLPPPSERRALRIDLFAVTNADKPYRSGDKIAFRVIGDPNCRVYVDIGDFQHGIDLFPAPPAEKRKLQDRISATLRENLQEPDSPLSEDIITAALQEFQGREIYEGDYTVEPGIEVTGQMARAHLVGESGAKRSEFDTIHAIHIDSRPPSSPGGIEGHPLDNKVRLTWNQNPESDLAAYEIWMSSTRSTGYNLVGKKENNTFILDNMVNFSKRYVKLKAIDKTGNESPFGDIVEVVALPDPDLLKALHLGPSLTGKISTVALLTPDNNPYTLLDELIITENGALHISPGVDIRFGPEARIHIDGGDLMVYGQREKPVRFSPQFSNSVSADWQGIILDNAKRVSIRNTSIENAEIGIRIINSAPTIFGVTITRCSQAGIYLSENAKPHIRCSSFIGNSGQGAMVIEGGGIAPVIRNNRFRDNAPFNVQSYTPLKIDLTENVWDKTDAAYFLGNIEWLPVLESLPALCDE